MEETSDFLLFDKALGLIIQNRERLISGLVNTIPFSFERFNKYVPGVQRENYVIVTASSGVGKSKLTKRMFVIDPIDFVLSNPQANIKLDIIYFCLEESKTRFILSLMVAWLHKHTNHRIDIKALLSYGELLPAEVIEMLRPAREHFSRIEKMLHIYDDVRNPYGIYKRVEKFMEANGTWSMKMIDIEDNVTKVITPKRVKDIYSTIHPEHYVVVVVDHISLIHPEKSHENSLHKAIQQLSSDYFLTLRDKYRCCIVAVQQQAADKEKQQYTFKGQSIESKLEPSLDGLGDNKMTQRDKPLTIVNLIKLAYFCAMKIKIEENKLKELVERGLKDTEIALILNVKAISVYFARKRYNIQREPIRGGKVEPTDRQWNIIAGSLLGDMSLSKTYTNTWGKVEYCSKSSEYLKWIKEELKNLSGEINDSARFDKRTQKTYYAKHFHIKANPALNEIYEKVYVNNRKVIPKYLLDKYNELSLAVHFMDDGFKTYSGYTLATDNFDQKSLNRLRLFYKERFNLSSSLHGQNRIHFPASSRDLFEHLINPHLHPIMRYKIVSLNHVNSVKA